MRGNRNSYGASSKGGRDKYTPTCGHSYQIWGKEKEEGKSMNWKWTLWWCAVWNGIALVYCFFLMEETNYYRKQPTVEPARQHTATHVGSTNGSGSEKGMEAGEKGDAVNSGPMAVEADVELAEVVWPRKTYLQKLGVINQPQQNRLLEYALAPLKGFTYPAVVYGGLMYGANNLVWSGTQNATTSAVYTKQYGFSTVGVAAAYSGGVLGTIIGGYYSGKVGRMLTLRLARCNNGTSEPEHTLYLFIASMVLVPFSMLLYGLGIAYHMHWFGLVFSQVLMATNTSFCIAAGLNYAIGSYTELSGGFVVTCVLIRNTMSFAINYGITPWLDAFGYRNTYIAVAIMGFVYNASLFIMVKYGRRLREMTAERYWRDVARARAKGLGH